MQRIRPAIHWLDENIGLPAALASERLKTDGAEILYDFSRQSSLAEPDAASAVEDLVVVRNQQRVFVPVVRHYLRTVSYQQGYVEQIRLPQYQMVEVIVDPRINSGTPTVARRGIRVADIVSRLAAGESAQDLARDYRLDPQEIARLATAAA